MGWCFGGGIALSFGLGGANHDATAIFYGRLLEDPARLRALTHEVYGTFAVLDTGIPPDAVERFVSALREAGVPNDVHVYDDVNHGFWLHADQDAARQAPALDAWQRLKAYLGRTLKQG
jgi:dienelactone hydrolase